MSEQFQVPYVCPKCEYDRWIVADPSDKDSHKTKCPDCGYEDTVNMPTKTVKGLDGLADHIESLR